MSDTDSFINEVTEEVRREKLYGYLRRYGWIAVALVLALVGGAAWNEYSNAQSRNAAEATGDALMAALEVNEPAARAAAMAQVEGEGAAAAVTMLLRAATQQEAGDIAGAAQTLGDVVTNPDLPEMYRDVAALKAAMLPSYDTATRRASLDALSEPGQPFRLLALEQMAYMTLAEGDADGAIVIMRQIEEDAGVTRGLRERVQTLMVALGEPLPDPVTQ
ncbi:tetratricopeptide repeat protein [Yoonia sp. GPGPB17]|uniref:tetratricopeptide repeat protein n=1 Tax=Yoonia sp. GPGPB17 TaxID=3026147 RepID=UPI0030C466ED